MATNTLPEAKRVQLDGIVQKMTANGETPANIQKAVNDFKSRVDPFNPFPTKTSSPQENAGILPTAGGIIGGIVGGAAGALAGVPGGPVGVGVAGWAGETAGSAVGGGAGEFLKEKIQGSPTDPSQIGLQAGTQGLLNAVGGPIVKAGAKLVEGVGTGIAKAVIPTTKQEAYLMQVYKAGNSFMDRVGQVLTGGGKAPPVTSGSTAFDKGLMGTETGIGIRAKRAADTLWNKFIDPALEKSPVKVDVPAFFEEAKAQIVKDTQELGDQASKLKALDSLSAEYKGMKTATMKQLQNFKKAWASKVPQKAYLGEDITAAYNNVRNTLAGLARTKIYSALGPEVRQAYLDHGNLQGLQQLGQKAMTGAGMKGGFGSFWSTVKDMAVVPIGTIGGQALYKVGELGEFVGAAGAKTLGALLGIPGSSPATPGTSPGQTPQNASVPPQTSSSAGLGGPAGGLQQPPQQQPAATPPLTQ